MAPLDARHGFFFFAAYRSAGVSSLTFATSIDGGDEWKREVANVLLDLGPGLNERVAGCGAGQVAAGQYERSYVGGQQRVELHSPSSDPLILGQNHPTAPTDLGKPIRVPCRKIEVIAKQFDADAPRSQSVRNVRRAETLVQEQDELRQRPRQTTSSPDPRWCRGRRGSRRPNAPSCPLRDSDRRSRLQEPWS